MKPRAFAYSLPCKVCSTAERSLPPSNNLLCVSKWFLVFRVWRKGRGPERRPRTTTSQPPPPRGDTRGPTIACSPVIPATPQRTQSGVSRPLNTPMFGGFTVFPLDVFRDVRARTLSPRPRPRPRPRSPRPRSPRPRSPRPRSPPRASPRAAMPRPKPPRSPPPRGASAMLFCGKK